jgi:RNA polymerase sigma-70 factor (ECF subfamily)
LDGGDFGRCHEALTVVSTVPGDAQVPPAEAFPRSFALSHFDTTHWSVILEGRRGPEQGQAALAEICAAYRRPVFAYLRGRGYAPTDADDLTQEFFARFVEHRWDQKADPQRGRFRSYLLSALHHFLANELASQRAHKRGGDLQRIDLDDIAPAAADAESPEQVFNRNWMLAVLEHAMRRLEHEACVLGKDAVFRRLADYLVEPPDAADYRQVAADLGMRVNTVAVCVHRLRQRLRELVREELARTVGDPADVDAELHALRDIAGGHVLS